MIRISDLEFRYGEEFCLRVPQLAIERGAAVAVIGPSGSGKTTLLNLISAIAVPRAGSVVTNGVEVSRLADVARRDFRVTHVGLVFQEFELLEYLNVFDNILLPYRINPSLRLDEQVRRRAADLARHVGMEDKLNRFASHLSQGEKQRVAVCRALLPEPSLLLADEPTGSLDPANKHRVLDILFDYAQRHRATLVTVTHDHELLARFDRVIDCKDFPDSAAARTPRSPGGEAQDPA